MIEQTRIEGDLRAAPWAPSIPCAKARTGWERIRVAAPATSITRVTLCSRIRSRMRFGSGSAQKTTRAPIAIGARILLSHLTAS